MRRPSSLILFPDFIHVLYNPSSTKDIILFLSLSARTQSIAQMLKLPKIKVQEHQVTPNSA